MPGGAGPLAFTLLMAMAAWPAAAAAQEAVTVTYTETIAPILFEHCVTCHHPDGIGPFSLLDYESARERSAMIATATGRRAMPPWKPVAPLGAFRGERTLTDEQIDLIARWAAADAPEGPLDARPVPPDIADGWQLGTPDIVATLPEAYTLPVGTTDVYRKFVMPVALDEPRWIRAVEIRPGSSAAIHHARIMIDPTGRARDLDAADPLPGFGGLMIDSGRYPPGHVLGWAPGKMPTVQPDSLSWPLFPGTDLIMQLHLLPGEAPVVVRPEVGLYYAQTPATLRPVSVVLSSMTIDIPAGEAAHVVRDGYRLPVAVDVLAIYPHAHYLGKEIHATATLPDGTERTLLRIDDWDFNWQDEYRYVEPVHLPADTRIEMRYVYDNSAANPANPNSPPQPVRFGPRSTDEMAQLLLQVLTIHPGDQGALMRNLRVKEARDEILGYQARLRRDPSDHEGRTGLAVRYLDVGQAEAALTELREAIRLAPDYPDAHYNMGAALQAQGQVEDAIAAYRRAIALDPRYGEAHNNLGALLEAVGDRLNAVAHYRLAIQFLPRQAGAHYNLATALMANEQRAEATAAYRRAIELQPNYAEAHAGLAGALMADAQVEAAIASYQEALGYNANQARALVELAWLRATAPVPAFRDAFEAMALAQRAKALLGADHPIVLDTLAAAYASAGRFELAITTAREAAARARATPGFESRAALIDQRVGAYLAHQPYRMPPSPSPSPNDSTSDTSR